MEQGRRWEKNSGGADPFRGMGRGTPKIAKFGQIIRVPLVNFFGTQDFGGGGGGRPQRPPPQRRTWHRVKLKSQVKAISGSHPTLASIPGQEVLAHEMSVFLAA